jgi:hypothetical protein
LREVTWGNLGEYLDQKCFIPSVEETMGRLRSRGSYGSVGCGLLHVVFCDQCFHQGSLFQPRHDIELMVLIDPS